jgi:hypothetical protein
MNTQCFSIIGLYSLRMGKGTEADGLEREIFLVLLLGQAAGG